MININSKCIKSSVCIYRNIPRAKSCELCWYSGPLLETQPIKYVKTEECKRCIQSWAAGVEEVWRQRSNTWRWNWSTNHSDMLESSASHHQSLSEKTMFICRRQIHMSGWLFGGIWWHWLTVYMTSLLFLMAQHRTMLKIIPMIYNRKHFGMTIEFQRVVNPWIIYAFANSYHYSRSTDSYVSNNMKPLIEKVCYRSKTILKYTINIIW